MSQPKRITVDMPADAGAHTEPVVAEKRYQVRDIEICQGTVDDLPELVTTFLEAFPESTWDSREPPDRRPEPATRRSWCADRLRILVDHPIFRTFIARDIHTHAFLGAATWAVPGSDIFSPFPRTAVEHFDLRKRFGWSEAHVDKVWSSMNLDVWEPQFASVDVDRRKIMGDEKHWYLATLIVSPQHQGRGIGGLLMKYGLDQADRSEQPLKIYLESSATAKPVYMRYGFTPIEGTHASFVRYPQVASTKQ